MDERDRQLILEQRRSERRAAKQAKLKANDLTQNAEKANLTSVTLEPSSGAGPKGANRLAFGGPDEPMLFVGHHKCASSLSSRYVKKFCEVNNLSFFGNGKGNTVPSGRHDVSFLGNASYPFLAERINGGGVHIIRNPLNVVQSAYYSHLRLHHTVGLSILAAQRRILEQCSGDEGMALTVAFCERSDFYPATPGPLCALRQWNFEDDHFKTVRMEDFGNQINHVFAGAIGAKAANYIWPEPHDFTFQAMSGGRDPGVIDENSPYRSGHPDAWRSELPKAVITYIRIHYQPLLERFYPEALLD
ncbi:hypothetical protein [Cyanobium sp. Morenito 9A2]|uniref:hypothetical protein n=1 Tax=Cyanobium sp. Morenito 9A2 TaxID=2823718 RepID=UPI0020CD52EA|nr:hypothetical protein [Cyanobium sp. Morenito 9A2]MCP9851126.1 hypothetical protein [Cyanobium sp. Morenito 9A2]